MSDRGPYAEQRSAPRLGWPGREWARPDMDTNGASQTLGEALLLSLSEHGHTIHDAAESLGTARANVHQWAKDLIDPWPENYDALTAYLGVALDTLGILIIHSQIRRAELRNQRTHTKRDATLSISES